VSAEDQIHDAMALQQRLAALGVVPGEAVAGRLGMAPTDLKCLNLLLSRPHTPGEIATELRLTPSAVTSVIDRLERAGFARRELSATDRRRFVITAVLDRSQQAIELYAPLFHRMKDLFTSYPPADLQVLRDFAVRASQVFQEEIAHLREEHRD
jgi:DNA-binding MarR family transcriptional regulator